MKTKKLLEVEAIKRDFVANVSHELRTPLTSIKGYTETLLNGALNDKTSLKKFLTIIDHHANRMIALIEDLLTISMLESNQLSLKLEKVGIKTIIHNVIQSFEKKAYDKGIALASDVNNDVSWVKADRVRLEQVLVNLVDNAIKYTNAGEIRIRVNVKGKFLKVIVEDTGIGISKKDLPRIFERFYRVDKGRSRDMGGTGLGLAIVKHIIYAHSGTLGVTSILGKGTSFHFLIPVDLKKSNQHKKGQPGGRKQKRFDGII